MRFGFEAYSWQTAANHYIGRLDHVIDVVSECRITGIEAEVCMLGPYAGEPTMLRAALDSRGMSLASVCYVEDWHGRGESDGEAARADWVIDYLDHFPGTLLQLCPRSGSDRGDLRERQRNAIRCMNDVSRRAADVSFLAETGFDGWAIVDDESPLAHADPDEAARRDAAYVHGTLSVGPG